MTCVANVFSVGFLCGRLFQTNDHGEVCRVRRILVGKKLVATMVSATCPERLDSSRRDVITSAQPADVLVGVEICIRCVL